MKIKKNNEALNYLNIAISISSANELYLKKGITLYNLQKYKEAIETFNKGLFLNDKIIDFYLNKGVVLNRIEKYKQAIDTFDQGLKLNPGDSILCNNDGVSYFRLEDY